VAVVAASHRGIRGTYGWLSERKQNAGSQESRGFNSEDPVHFLAFDCEKNIVTRANHESPDPNQLMIVSTLGLLVVNDDDVDDVDRLR